MIRLNRAVAFKACKSGAIIVLCTVLLISLIIDPIAIHAAEYRGMEVKEGSIITLGQIENDGDKKEDIEWRILHIESADENKNGKNLALLLSEKVLVCMPYSLEAGDVDWESSHARSWLNSYFPEQFFSDSEFEDICEVELENKGNSHYKSTEEDRKNNEKSTKDKIFLLSEEEVKEYLPDLKDRKAVATDSAKEDDIFVSEISEGSFWWLRTGGEETTDCMCVGAEGGIVLSGYPAVRSDFGFRPAVYLMLD